MGHLDRIELFTLFLLFIKKLFTVFKTLCVKCKKRNECYFNFSTVQSLMVVWVACLSRHWIYTSFCKRFVYDHLVFWISLCRYKKRNIYEITDKDFREKQTSCLNTVKHIAVSPDESKMLATANRSQLYEIKLWGPEMDIVRKLAQKQNNFFKDRYHNKLWESENENLTVYMYFFLGWESAFPTSWIFPPYRIYRRSCILFMETYFYDQWGCWQKR